MAREPGSGWEAAGAGAALVALALLIPLSVFFPWIAIAATLTFWLGRSLLRRRRRNPARHAHA